MTINTNLHCVDASTRRGSSGVSLGSSIYAVYRISFVMKSTTENKKLFAMNERNKHLLLPNKNPRQPVAECPQEGHNLNTSLWGKVPAKNRKNLIRFSRLLFSGKNSKIDQAMCSTKIWPASSSMSARLTQFSHACLRETFLEKRQIKTITFDKYQLEVKKFRITT